MDYNEKRLLFSPFIPLNKIKKRGIRFMKQNTILKKIVLLLALVIAAATITQASPAGAASEFAFTDVKSTNWFYDAVKYVSENGFMTGTSKTTFEPNLNCSRAMVVTVLYRMAGEPDIRHKEQVFPDVPTGKWYSNAVAWAKENKIVNGYTSGKNQGKFGTDDDITRQDFTKILKGYADYIKVDIGVATKESYTVRADASQVAGYAKPYIEWAYQRNFIGQGSDINPRGKLTRAETAAMIMRFDKAAKKAKNEPYPIAVSTYVKGAHFIGDELTAADFDITVKMSDCSEILNPNGYAVYPLKLSSAKNILTCVYQGIQTTFEVNVTERPNNNLPCANGFEIAKYAVEHPNPSYIIGGRNIDEGTDCCGYTYLIYKHFGVNIPSGLSQGNFREPMDFEDVKIGDLLAMYDPESGYHEYGVYIGNNRIMTYWGSDVHEIGDEEKGYFRKVFNNTYNGDEEEDYLKLINIIVDRWMDSPSVWELNYNKLDWDYYLEGSSILDGEANIAARYHPVEIDLSSYYKGYYDAVLFLLDDDNTVIDEIECKIPASQIKESLEYRVEGVEYYKGINDSYLEENGIEEEDEYTVWLNTLAKKYREWYDQIQ